MTIDEGSSTVPPAESGQNPVSVRPTAPTATPQRVLPDEPSFVLALGKVVPRFSSLAAEKEFAQVAGRAATEGLTDSQVFQRLLTDRPNRYLARQMCWVFHVEGIETYIVLPRDPMDLDLLMESVRAEPRRDDVDVVVGARGPIAPADACNGLMLPIVLFDQLYSFDRDSLIKEIPRPEAVAKNKEEQFRSSAGELFDRIMQIADNAGATDEHRALNYLTVRYPAIYATTASMHAANKSLTGVEVRPSRLAAVRRIVDVIFSYTHRDTDVTDQFFVRVDTTEMFPFLVTKLSPYYER